MAASGGTQRFIFKREATLGIEATGSDFLGFRATQGMVGANKRAVTSEIIRADRSTDANIQVFRAAEASLESELLCGDVGHNEMYARALFSSFTAGDLTAEFDVGKGGSDSMAGTTVTTSATNVITCTGATFTTDGLKAGAWLAIDDLNAAVNGYWKVVSVDSQTAVTVNPAGISYTGTPLTFGNFTGSGDEDFAFGFIRNATLRKGLTIERGFPDVGEYLRSIGCVVNTMNVRLEAEQIGRCSFEFLGTGWNDADSSADASVTLGTSTAISASTNVVRLYKDNTALGVGARSLEFTVNNNINQLTQIASVTAADVIAGRCQIEGTLEAYFTDRAALHDLLVDHTPFSIEFVGIDDQGGMFAV